jgi:hypothetical protein
MTVTPQPVPDARKSAPIKVVGIGGGGIHAVNRMIQEGLRAVELTAIDTDAQALELSDAPNRIRIGNEAARGLSSGGDPSIGLKAAEESRDDLYRAINGADMVFIVAGTGRILEAMDTVRRADEEAYQARKARQAERRRAVLQPLPLADVTIEAVTGDDPALVLVQGESTITVKLPQVLALVGALSNAAVNLAELLATRGKGTMRAADDR